MRTQATRVPRNHRPLRRCAEGPRDGRVGRLGDGRPPLGDWPAVLSTIGAVHVSGESRGNGVTP